MPNSLTTSQPIGQGFLIQTSNAGYISFIVDVGGAGGVTSVFGRTGAVVAQNGDYTSSQITDLSGAPGANVTDALNALGPATKKGTNLTDAAQSLDPSATGDAVGQYSCLDATLTASRTKTIVPTNMGSQQTVVIANGAQTFTMPVVNGGGAGGTLFTFPGDGLRRSASFSKDVGTGQMVFGGWWFTEALV